MKKLLFLTLILSAFWGETIAQKLVIGEKAPDVRIKEWISQRPADDTKPKLIGFFHSASKQSQSQIDNFEAIAVRYRGKINVVVIAKEPKERVIELIYAPERSYYAAMDDAGKTFDNYGVQFVPFSVLLDQKGRVLWFGNPMSIDERVLDGAVK